MKRWTTFTHLKIPHGITNKQGGFSQGHFSSMNTAFYGDDDFFVVMKNLREVLNWLNKPVKAIFATRQIHGAHIKCVDDESQWSEFEKYDTRNSALEGIDLYVVDQCDGLITKREDVLLMTYYADCVPLIMWDPVQNVVGTAHSGWRGTTLEISKKMVLELENHYQSQIKDLSVGIGHAAGVCCYEVGQDVYAAFNDVFPKEVCASFFIKNKDKYLLDLKKAIEIQFLSLGLEKEQIQIERDCTLCTVENGNFVYHSHRRDGTKRGSMSAFVAL